MSQLSYEISVRQKRVAYRHSFERALNEWISAQERTDRQHPLASVQNTCAWNRFLHHRQTRPRCHAFRFDAGPLPASF